MQIIVKTQKDDQIALEVQPTDMVIDVKNKIKESLNIPSEKQSLTFNGTHLEDKKTLQECNIVNDSTVNLVVMINLLIKLPSGRECKFPCEQNTKIVDAREYAANESAIHPDQLNVIYEGRMLDDNATIESAGLKDDTMITVMTIPTA